MKWKKLSKRFTFKCLLWMLVSFLLLLRYRPQFCISCICSYLLVRSQVSCVHRVHWAPIVRPICRTKTTISEISHTGSHRGQTIAQQCRAFARHRQSWRWEDFKSLCTQCNACAMPPRFWISLSLSWESECNYYRKIFQLKYFIAENIFRCILCMRCT